MTPQPKALPPPQGTARSNKQTIVLAFFAREEFPRATRVRVRVCVPLGRSVRSASFLRSDQNLTSTSRDGCPDVTVPRMLIHEAVSVGLA